MILLAGDPKTRLVSRQKPGCWPSAPPFVSGTVHGFGSRGCAAPAGTVEIGHRVARSHPLRGCSRASAMARLRGDLVSKEGAFAPLVEDQGTTCKAWRRFGLAAFEGLVVSALEPAQQRRQARRVGRVQLGSVRLPAWLPARPNPDQEPRGSRPMWKNRPQFQIRPDRARCILTTIGVASRQASNRLNQERPRRRGWPGRVPASPPTAIAA